MGPLDAVWHLLNFFVPAMGVGLIATLGAKLLWRRELGAVRWQRLAGRACLAGAAVSIGGDAIIGTSYAELMPYFEADPETQAIAIYSEPGGRMEAELAEWVTTNKSRLPIVAFMAGRFMDEMQGMRFGHAGTIVEGKEDTTAAKIERMEKAGISVAERIEEIPKLIQKRLGDRS